MQVWMPVGQTDPRIDPTGSDAGEAMATTTEAEYLVVGGGVVGAAIAYGLLKAGHRTCLLDEGDDAFRAARGNFGLVWVQGKGAGCADYARWSVRAAREWAGFAASLEQISGIDLQLQQQGGLHLCLNAEEVEVRRAELQSAAAIVGEPYPYEILDAAALRAYLPEVGPEVVGGSFSPMDGHVSPLRLLRALHQGIKVLGGQLRSGFHIDRIVKQGDAYVAHGPAGSVGGARVVLAAGLGNRELAPMVGLEAPVVPVRGQVLICERARPFLPLPTLQVRQTGDGGVQIGDSKENVGMNDATSVDQLSRIAARALKCFPVLANLNVVRTWGALRVMSPDGLPMYQESCACPGAYLVSCHSGVTLASVHAGALVEWLTGGARPAPLDSFSTDRFHV
jgi:glycine/D-amino acid oxidase-like deaminating enzyme